MKYNITPQGPTSLNCPECGEECNFEAMQNTILCKSCETELELDKVSKHIQEYAFLVLITFLSIGYFIELGMAIDTTIVIIGFILYFYLPLIIYKKSHLIKKHITRRSNGTNNP